MPLKLNVMVVDMLEGFTRIGPLASPRVASLIPKQIQFLECLAPRSNVVFLQDAHEPNDREFTYLPVHCLKGSAEAQLCSEFSKLNLSAKGIRETVVLKRQFSGFFNTPLEFLVGSDIWNNEWVVFGCVTDCCIEANIADLSYRNNKITVFKDLTDTWDTTKEQLTSNNLPRFYLHNASSINDFWFDYRLPSVWGVRVMTSQQFLSLDAKGEIRD